MRNVLLITYSFPPAAGPAVHRPYGFVKHWPAMDWKPTVLTVHPKAYQSSAAQGVDESMASGFPSDVDVERTGSWEPVRLRAFFLKTHLFRLANTFLSPFFYEPQALWTYPCLYRALRLVKTKKFDLIFTTALPFTTLWIGAWLSRMTRIPWVSDLRDPYTSAGGRMFPSKIHYRMFRALEAFGHAQASAVTVVTPTMRSDLLEEFHDVLTPEKIKVVLNGYDEDLFPAFGSHGDQGAQNVVKVVYAGTIADVDAESRSWFHRHVDYQHRPVNFSTRSLYFFLLGWRQALDEHLNPTAPLELHLYAKIGPKTKRLIHKLGLTSKVFIHDMIPHREIPQVLSGADYQLLPLETPLDCPRSPFLTGKIFEYMASGTPVLLLSPPESDARDILEKVGGFIVAPSDDPVAISQLLETLSHSHSSTLRFDRKRSEVSRYTRKESAQQMVRVFESVVGEEGD